MASKSNNVTKLEPVPELKPDQRFLCVGYLCYGMGKTIAEAKSVAKSNNRRDGLSQYAVFIVHKDSTVTGMGGISYPLAHGEPVEVERKGPAKRK